MGRLRHKPLAGDELRRKAEAVFAARPTAAPQDGAATVALLHELSVHQIELELQNEQLQQAQLELEASRDSYAALYDNAPVAYLTIDREGAIVRCNLLAGELLGADRSRLLGLKLTSLMTQDDADVFHLKRMALLRGARKQTCEVDLRGPDGRTFRARLDGVADTVTAAGFRCNVGLIDMSELRGAQADLQASEARFRLIAENVQDVFYLRELGGVISYVSPAFERIWGRPAAQLAGKPEGWLDPEDREQVNEAWKRLGAGVSISDAYRIRQPDGTLRWVESRGFPILGDDGVVRAGVGVVRDVTHERMLEQALRHAQKMEAVGTLASGVAHNLRNVLQAILNCLEVIRVMLASGEPVVAMLDRATTATKRGAVLIDQLMTFARKQEAVGLLPVRLDDVLCEAMGLIKPLVTDAITLALDAGAPDAVVLAHPVQLEQILLNLAANARDAMPRGGTLTITSTEVVLDEPAAKPRGLSPGPHLVVTVKDTGQGMDAETKARMFEPFFTTKDIGRGTGLGLSTVFALVQQFGGAVEVDSAPEAGTTFRIYLPALRGARG